MALGREHPVPQEVDALDGGDARHEGELDGSEALEERGHREEMLVVVAERALGEICRARGQMAAKERRLARTGRHRRRRALGAVRLAARADAGLRRRARGARARLHVGRLDALLAVGDHLPRLELHRRRRVARLGLRLRRQRLRDVRDEARLAARGARVAAVARLAVHEVERRLLRGGEEGGL